MDLLKTTENKKRAGHRNFRLLFYAYALGFGAVLATGVSTESVKLYFYFCIFSALSQGLFTAKDVLNTLWHKKYSNGNHVPNDEEVEDEKS